MSRFKSEDDNLNNSSANNHSDTFLSRVFGLHSIYNQLQENYQYYDSEIDSLNYNNNSIHSSVDENDSPLLKPVAESSKNVLNSESDLDLSSDSDQDKPHNIVPSPPIVESNYRQRNTPSTPSQQDQAPYANEEEKSPPHKIKFETPNIKKAKKMIFGSNKDDSTPLPIYNKPQQFRKQSPQNGVSEHTSYQAKTHRNRRLVIPPRERALYLWANIVNMDEFLIDLYYYYRGKGLTNIVLSRIVNLVILIFILGFTVFLKYGIDYNFFFNEWNSNLNQPITLGDLIIPNFFWNNIPFSIKFLLFGFSCYLVLRVIQLYFDYKFKLTEIKNFYTQLIVISNDDELMTISWITIVERLMLLKEFNTLTSNNDNLPPHYLNDLNSKIRLNAHDIANRIMRKENYMIALINKEILDLSIPLTSNIPLLKNFFNTRSVLTKTLEWNLKLCINNFVFNNNGQINSKILKEANRYQLSRELQSRFKMAAIINLLLCPFIVIYFVLLYFFRYFNEYKSNPSSIIGLRQYTPWAEWKLREFNELPHFFIKRLHLSIGPANTYINQFPGGFLIINLMTLLNFISGAITAVLVIMGIWFEDEDHRFWSFEITSNKSTLFYISLFGTLWAVTSNSLQNSTISNSSENLNNQSLSFFYDPEASLRYVSQFTHYLPSSWNGKLHTVEVKNEFCELYSLKILIIINEIISLILTPFILWFKVSNCSGSIVDFFRDYSIHVDGLGYVCSFAMFNFEEKDKNMMHDFNKRRKLKKLRQKQKKFQKRKMANDNIELENIKPKHTHSDSNSDTESDESSFNDDYHDDKMIKSYMYFLESYAGQKEQPSKSLANNNIKSQPREAGPSPSIMIQRQKQKNGFNSNSPNLSLSESAYNVNYKLAPDDELSDDGIETKGARGKKGVLGMLNQFYKQDSSR